MEVACVALVGLVVSIINAAILSGLLQSTLSVICGAIAGTFSSSFCPFFVSGGKLRNFSHSSVIPFFAPFLPRGEAQEFLKSCCIQTR